ncbi:hypothetical protein DPMN_177464 [Dreissena polymorpha]|uniref:Uncharacterized protein n=1 Tax=Dreissena polymorpha TaxID=45954 RepID=A0A9D4EC81_DREPO|nr:hypothetical protein DPMN_177464 [Dreissena polymorpha]
MVLSSRIVTDQHGSFEHPKLPCWPPGAPRTFPDVPRLTRIDTELHGGYTVRMPEHPGYEPC